MVVVVNKWDRVDKTKWTMEQMKEDVVAQLRAVGWASVVCTTAIKGERRDGPGAPPRPALPCPVPHACTRQPVSQA